MAMVAHSFLEAFTRNWWVLLVRGVFAVLFGVLAFWMPGITLATLVLLYGAYAFVDGITALWVGGRARAGWFVLGGVLGVAAGILTFVYPGITAMALLYVIAAWAIVRGVLEIATAIELRKVMSNEWLLALAGVLSIVFGLALVANPAAGALAVVWIIGAYALVFGLIMIVLAFRLRGLPGRLQRLASGA
jgi:uncharacterized membrane protein HdeD (DUF308 family)